MQIEGKTVGKLPVLVIKVTKMNILKLKRLSYAQVDAKAGYCYIPAFSPFLDFNLKDIKAIFGDVEYDKNAKNTIKGYQNFMVLYDKKELKPSFDFVLKPYLHQRNCLVDLIYNFRWNLNLDPGTGKTKIIIDLIRYIQKPTLILAPSSLLENWVDEFTTHSRGENKVTIFSEKLPKEYFVPQDEEGNVLLDEKGNPKRKAVPQKVLRTKWLKSLKTDVLLVGYNSAALYQDEIMAYFDYDLIVADESHRMKSYKAAISIGARNLAKKAYRRVTMSGTYILNSPIDAWPQIDFLSPTILNTPFYKFRDDYCNYHKMFRHQVIGYKNMDRLNGVINKFSTRYTKEEVTDMPGRTVVKLYYDLTSEQQKWYMDVLSEDDLIFNDGNIPKDHKVTLLGKLAQLCKGYVHLSNKEIGICDNCSWVTNCVEEGIKPYTKPCTVVQKAPAPTKRRLKSNPVMGLLMDLLNDLLNDGRKAIIWASGVESLDMISEVLTKAKIGFIRITDSNTTVGKVRDFNTRDDISILLSSVATGIGYTANSAQYSIYYSLDFSLEHYLQSRDRNYRINTKHKVTEYHLLARNTVDEKYIEALEFKQDIADTLLTNIDCSICPKNLECKAAGINIFSKKCRFKSKVSRSTIKV